MIKRLIKNNNLLLSIFRILLIIVIVIALVPGCGKKKETQKQKSEKQKAPKTKERSIESLDAPPKLSYQFLAEGMRDPFKPFIRKKQKQTAKEGMTSSGRPRTLLETYDITSLKLTGIISAADPSKNTALIEDVAGKGFIVRVGNYIGKNEGIITQIDRNTVVITEKHLDEIIEEIISKEIKLTLEEKEGE